MRRVALTSNVTHGWGAGAAHKRIYGLSGTIFQVPDDLPDSEADELIGKGYARDITVSDELAQQIAGAVPQASVSAVPQPPRGLADKIR